ncbi:unnamed protein product [Prorocentrum cordatum]|uniref:Uncharacterized protein n=1 Tax=Prorocentrum cordatum TaxID=2364126 RepID=A0ABN9SVY5_9DINO|nr:unnamed protein product [Polarella glacialis]
MEAALVEAAAKGAAEGGGSRQVVAAAVAAACRCVMASAQPAHAGGDDVAELAVRLAAMAPAMLQRIRGQWPDGQARSRRNVGAHWHLGKADLPIELLEEALLDPQRSQRGARQHAQYMVKKSDEKEAQLAMAIKAEHGEEVLDGIDNPVKMKVKADGNFQQPVEVTQQEGEPIKKDIECASKEVLSNKFEKVVDSSRMVDSPCVLELSEYDWSANMVRITTAQAPKDSMTDNAESEGDLLDGKTFRNLPNPMGSGRDKVRSGGKAKSKGHPS